MGSLDLWLTAYAKLTRNSNTIDGTSMANPNFQDRVVQEVIYMLLSAIYEPRFKE